MAAAETKTQYVAAAASTPETKIQYVAVVKSTTETKSEYVSVAPLKGAETVFILEFPQNIMGFIAFIYYTKIKKQAYYQYRTAYVTHVAGRWGAVSFGRYIFADDRCFKHDIIKHEYGHSLQSQRLLFLYLPLIGLPSLIWNRFFKGYRKRNNKNYYSFYTEAWANQLGDYSIKQTRKD